MLSNTIASGDEQGAAARHRTSTGSPQRFSCYYFRELIRLCLVSLFLYSYFLCSSSDVLSGDTRRRRSSWSHRWLSWLSRCSTMGIAEDECGRFWQSWFLTPEVVVRLDCCFGYRFDPFTFQFYSGSSEGFRVWDRGPRSDPVRCQSEFLLGTALKDCRVRASVVDALWLVFTFG